MRSLLTFLLLCSLGLFAQEAIPPGTVLPVQLKSTLDSLKSKPGQTITARIMQDVPLSVPQQGQGKHLLGNPPGLVSGLWDTSLLLVFFKNCVCARGQNGPKESAHSRAPNRVSRERDLDYILGAVGSS